MKDFLTKNSTKLLIGFCLFVAVGFTIGISIVDGKLNLMPLAAAGGFFAFVFALSQLFKNNP